MIILNVIYTVKEGQRRALYEALTPKAEYFRREAGNLRYDYFSSCEDENCLLLLEWWENAEALAAHSKTETFAALKEIKEKFVLDTSIQKFEMA